MSEDIHSDKLVGRSTKGESETLISEEDGNLLMTLMKGMMLSLLPRRVG